MTLDLLAKSNTSQKLTYLQYITNHDQSEHDCKYATNTKKRNNNNNNNNQYVRD